MTVFGGVAGHLARPSGQGPWPALIVVQEWWGLDDQTRSIADRFAKEGYLAFAPDLYHGELARLGDAAAARALVQKHGPGAAAELAKVRDAIVGGRDCSGRLGAVGFCFGGRKSLELALSRRLNAVCSFYGGGMHEIFDRLERIDCPVLGLFGDRDASIPVGTVEELDRVLDRAGVKHEVVVYPGSGHAFFRDSDPSVYKPEAARDAWERAKRFFAEHLKGA